MPTKPLDRLMFAQGGLCFFCKNPLPKSEASIEHLLASANGGSNNDENCVACCKAINALLGSMSLKEKIQVVLNQKGQFKCPNGTGCIAGITAQMKDTPKLSASTKFQEDTLALMITNLKQCGNARPRSFKALKNYITSHFSTGLSDTEIIALIQQLQTTGKITVIENKVTYEF